ncbi:hypothetical protein J3Q64DRAFT_1847623 [Phycomyces blakesleeanus]|uniref:Fungal-type protein kinase domain-containing protein n=2 Tax=Phycomyces blakesleeanus TaxID=4837 RepID=A0A163AA11_PHYB8|nr:hypothetical protein PHYBLDRAFT_147030 [Phycomyces blakesleeanus NRRL 1555(-)]OAD72051.1 hypothetical protein PHYBLDRAFT_147030 [Phycomyces blakesleeanus NRRL 1555(-)]|eukprot:XP_018290091.1 hypothetical protein PHYBLDRAFT_147030 [Phycomyces blakesleeanus NRRL 1555(-)]
MSRTQVTRLQHWQPVLIHILAIIRVMFQELVFIVAVTSNHHNRILKKLNHRNPKGVAEESKCRLPSGNDISLKLAFIDPFLSGLLDGPNKGVYLCWTNEPNLKAKRSYSNMRPDLFITKNASIRWARSLGYGEASPTTRKSNQYLVYQDLIKIVLFCKESLDEHLMEEVLRIHIVGRTVGFYILVLSADATYVMYLLAGIKVPDSIHDLHHFITELPLIFKILHVFDTMCVCSDVPENVASQRAPTMSSRIL